MESEYKWPKVVKPSAVDWNIWDMAIMNTFQVHWYLNLPQKLGTFYHNMNTGWFYNPDEQAIWHN